MSTNIVVMGKTSDKKHVEVLVSADGTIQTSGGGGGGTQYAEDTTHTTGDSGTPALVVRKDAAATIATTDGDYTMLQVDANGALRVVGGTSSTQYAEDTVHQTGDTGTAMLVVRKDAAATIATTDGDYTLLQVDATGNLRTTASATIGASENHLGKVGGNTPIIAHTLSSDTAILASGDIIATTEAISNALRVNDGTGILQSLVLIDEADQKASLTLYFLSANTTMGTENAAVTITDAGAADILGWVDIDIADYKDLGGVSIATKNNIGIVLLAASGARTLYVAAVNGTGTPTYGAAGALKLRLGIAQD